MCAKRLAKEKAAKSIKKQQTKDEQDDEEITSEPEDEEDEVQEDSETEEVESSASEEEEFVPEEEVFKKPKSRKTTKKSEGKPKAPKSRKPKEMKKATGSLKTGLAGKRKKGPVAAKKGAKSSKTEEPPHELLTDAVKEKNALFSAMFEENVALNTITQTWVSTFSENPLAGLKIFLFFLLERTFFSQFFF